jgi:hypothetical protein
MALRWFAPVALALLATLAGCAARNAFPTTTLMGAGPACDLRIDVGSDHRCAVQHVAPADDVQLLTNGMHAQEVRTAPVPATTLH